MSAIATRRIACSNLLWLEYDIALENRAAPLAMTVSFAGKLCHACSLLTLVSTIAAYLLTDVKDRYNSVVGTGYVAELAHFQHATFILGTAWVLEFFLVVASAAHAHRRPKDLNCVDVVPRSQFSQWTDSHLMFMVYSILFAFYFAMAVGSFGLVHVDPFASNRPVYGLRYMEWSLAVPILMLLVGRSIPHASHLAPTDLAPAILLTVIYIYASLLALIIDSYAWRVVLIIISFVGYFLAAWDQCNWIAGCDRQAPAGSLKCGLLLFQVLLFGIYGVVYLLAAFDLVSPAAEQAFYTFGDATSKVGHSAVLLAMRQQEILTAVQTARWEAAVTAADLARLVDCASVPILRVDLEGRVSTWNRKLVELTGRSDEAMQGTLFIDVVSSPCRGEVAAAIDACARQDGDASERFHVDLLAVPVGDDAGCGSERQPEVVSLLMNVTPQRNGDGSTTGVVCVSQDRTEVVHYQAVEERKNRFMATVSHELRSPLHGICGLASGLEESEPDEARRRQIAMVRSCATRLLDLVVNIMDLSAQRKGTKSLAKDPVHLSAILEEVVALISSATDKSMRPLLGEKCRLINKVAGTALPIVEGDAYKLTQVFFNLLTNACKFCRAGHIEVAAETDHAENLVCVIVSDTGIGIAPEALERIFEPFEQEDNSVGRNFEGIGIGLSVSDGVVQQHGGKISVRSVQGQGSSFTVSLPFVPDVASLPKSKSSPPLWPEGAAKNGSAPSPELAGRLAPRHVPPPTPSVTTPTLRPIVLSVDDDIVNQEVVKSALPEFEVHTAMDGAAALRYFAMRSRLPDVVLLDVMMPGMSGYEVCTEVRNQLQLPPSILPIIMLSANEPLPDSIIEGLGSGCNDYMSKPFEARVLQARVQTALQVKRLHEVELEHAQHAKLLHEIMPPSIVERLLAGESCISESHPCVTILFSDIVGWTNIAESIPTSAVITLLNQLFSAFDALLDEHGVFKVETIGDAYMVAAGHDGCADHAKRIMLMGLSMLEAVRGVRPPPGMRLQIRVGVHSGPAFTGVVGQRVPRYCFFGDTVNVSSRMESNGVPGCIHISQAARDRLGDVVLPGANITSRGAIDVKGKGRMETHFVVPTGVSLPPMESGGGGLAPPEPPALEGSDVEKSLRAQLTEADATISALRAERDQLRQCGSRLEQAVHCTVAAAPTHHTPKRRDDAATSLCSSPVETSTRGFLCPPASDPATTALCLELAVKKRALERARRALLEKDDEIDAKELELQHALAVISGAGGFNPAGIAPRALLASQLPPCRKVDLATATSSEEGQWRNGQPNGIVGMVVCD